ncbi:ABC transporter permease [Pyrodictium abyssi]|uniref:ABC transporter permease n=1 Tax=Pyrodictium abyssi TaxID=54256 RepID=A0ABM8IXC7_9CREN|nr:hypothetical protein PABY_17690 [Pyrodictium abyssi]
MLARAGLRALARRRLETAAIVVLVAVSVAGFLVIRMASGYALALAGKAWVYEVGNILVGVSGGAVDAGEVAQLLQGLPVEKLKVIEAAWTVGYYNGTPLSVVLVYNPDPGPPFSYTPALNASGDRVLLYATGSRLRVPEGATLLLGPQGELRVTVAGVVRGIAVVSAGDLALYADREIVERAAASGGSLEAAIAIVLRPGADAEAVKDEVLERLGKAGYNVSSVFVNTEEDNPARRPIEGVARALETLTLAGQAIALLLIASTSLLAVERGIREVGVLESLGATRLQVAVFYSAHNIARGLAGALLGLAAAIPLSRLLVEWGLRSSEGDETATRLLMELYQFSPRLEDVAVPYAAMLASIVAAAVVPPLLYARGETAPKLRYTGRLEARPRLARLAVLGPEAALALRRLAARPWKLAAFVLLAALVWGSLASIGMVSRGYEHLVARVGSAGYTLKLYVPGDLLEEALEKLRGLPGVEATDTYCVYWNSLSIHDENVVVFVRVSGDEYLWYPLVQGRLPASDNEAVVSTRLAAEHGLGVGDTVEAETPRGTIRLKVVGVADIPTNNGLAVLVTSSPAELLGSAGECMVLVRASGDPYRLALEAKRTLVSSGIPAAVYTGEEGVRNLREAGTVLKVFMLVMESGVLLAGLLGLALAGVVDLAAHLREVGVLRAIGYTDRRIALLEAMEVAAAWLLSAPVALAVGYAMASHMTGLMRSALGAIEPRGPLASLLEAAWIAPPVLALTTAAWVLYLRRVETTRLLAEQ